MPNLKDDVPPFYCDYVDCERRVNIYNAVFVEATEKWGFYCDEHLPRGALVRERYLPRSLRGICPTCGWPRGGVPIDCPEDHEKLKKLRWLYVNTYYFKSLVKKGPGEFSYFPLRIKTFESLEGESTSPQCEICDRPTVMGGSLKSWTTWCGTRVDARLCSSCYQTTRDISLDDLSYIRGLEILKSKVSPAVSSAPLQTHLPVPESIKREARRPISSDGYRATSTGRFNCSHPAIQDVPKPQGVGADQTQHTMEELFKFGVRMGRYGRTTDEVLKQAAEGPLHLHDAVLISPSSKEPSLLYAPKYCPSCGRDEGCMCPRIEEPCRHLHTEWVSPKVGTEIASQLSGYYTTRVESDGIHYLACKNCGRLV